MKCWLIEVGEPLPFDDGKPRLLRTGLLAQHLEHAGHDVIWWASRFNHRTRSNRAGSPAEVRIGPRSSVRLLDGHRYQKSLSLNRIIHHRALATAFTRQAPAIEPPDIIVCCMPTIELAAAAVDYGETRGIPVLLDLRDLWPDIWFDMLPPVLRPAARFMGRGAIRTLGSSCSRAAGLIGITSEFLDWGLTYAGREQRSSDAVAPHAYPTPEASPASTAAANSYWDDLGVTGSDDQFIIAFVGSLSRRIRRQGFLHDAVGAAANLANECPGMKLVISGGGEEQLYWQRRASSLTNVIVTGHRDRASLLALLKRSRLGLVPYPNSADFVRSIPNKVAEYLSMGLPIVSSLDGALGRFVRQHGCGEVYRAGDASMLAAALRRLYRDRVRLDQMSQHARAAYEGHLDAGRIYPELVRHLESVARISTTSVPQRAYAC